MKNGKLTTTKVICCIGDIGCSVDIEVIAGVPDRHDIMIDMVAGGPDRRSREPQSC